MAWVSWMEVGKSAVYVAALFCDLLVGFPVMLRFFSGGSQVGFVCGIAESFVEEVAWLIAA